MLAAFSADGDGTTRMPWERRLRASRRFLGDERELGGRAATCAALQGTGRRRSAGGHGQRLHGAEAGAT
ncbi:hypothetical protein TRIUR3_15506 [Triticum urartu]|uniref:Uncharacterized protein n=1 Tax=Triticum urartu TaxID=4572 RepID=M7ZTQ0_TRIUA|nr:hypothetical protein TRIUR3_15506 [Triticum urartu]